MGAITKEDTITGRDLKTAFKKLQDSDREELGNDYYNGSWHNAQGVVEVSRSKFYGDDEPSKHEPAWVLCTQKPIGNDMKTKTTVTNFPANGTRKWVTKYEVTHPEWGNVVVSELKQGDAIKKARELVEKNPDWELTVTINKRITKQPNKVAEINYKKSSKEKDGRWEIKGCLAY
jgi:hypothetical protein